MMLVFPWAFPYQDVFIAYDSAYGTVFWDGFTKALEDCYMSFHKTKYAGYRATLYQVRPLLSSCYRSVLSSSPSSKSEAPLEPAGDAVVTISQNTAMEEYVARWVEVSKNLFRPHGEDADTFLLRQLHFFAPALIWAYFELRKAAIAIDNSIRAEEYALAVQDWLIGGRSGPPPTAVYDRVNSLPTDGMALQLRRELRRDSILAKQIRRGEK